MKYCPNCRSSYADDTLKFCLQDGTPLVGQTDSSTELPTVVFGDETEQFKGEEVTEQFKTNQATERFTTNKDFNQMRVDLPETRQHSWEQSRETQIASHITPPQKSNTLVAVLGTALVMLIIFGAIGIGAWFYFSKPETEVAKNTNNQSNSGNKPGVKENSNEKLPMPTATTKDSTPKPTPSSEETPTSTFNPDEVKKEVSDVIYSWKSASESLNLEAHISKYADTVDYFNKSKVNRNFIKSDRQKAYNKYQYIKIDLSNMSVTPDSTGENATAVFDKAWRFENDEKTSEGKVRSQLKLSKINGQWKITGEKDLKVYFVK
jgi:ketosteroid isomerase-like protein